MKHFFEALLAIIYYRYPARNLYVIGVTGTDGKTTTSSLIYHTLKLQGKKVALINTVGAYIGNQKIDTGLHVTTPGSWFIQKFLRTLVEKKYEYVVLESTSHGLDQHRLLGANFSIGVLTNLTHEHLDYHRTMQKYARSKAKLFRRVKVAFVNFHAIENVNFRKIIERDNLKIVDYNLKFLKSYSSDVNKAVKTKFPQAYNQLNAIAAIEVCKEVGVEDSVIVKAIQSFPGIPGRFEVVKNKKGIHAYIDFAHTPYSMHELLKHLKSKLDKKQKLIVVFGCAGDRDIEKRPMMGEVASKYADVIILTSEDPRRENPSDINAAIKSGILSGKKYKGRIIEEDDRQKAISMAVSLAKSGDVVVSCGKGHEKSLNIKGVEYPWSENKAFSKAFRAKLDIL